MFSVAPNILLAPNMTQNAERKHRTQNTNTAHNRPLIFVYSNSNLAIRNSTFLNHSTALHGSVIYGSQNSNIALMESKMHHNQANLGGVIYIVYCTLQIDNTISDSN